MKAKRNYLGTLLCITFLLLSCEKQDDNSVPEDLAVNNFIWKGLNLYYLWQTDVPNLADARFHNQVELNQFLYGYPDHDNLFQQLLYKPKSIFTADGEAVDRFSVLFSDYNKLEGILSGTTATTGTEIGLYYKDSSQTDVFGIVRYVLPNSDAALKNVYRGDLFYAINGTPLNKDNYSSLLSTDSYTLNWATYDNGAITPNGLATNLTKGILSENPVYLNQIINAGAHKIGYLLYNGFYPNYESQLNAAFGALKGQGITELILDLRYNPGGSIATASRLASMITGQFNNQLFAKEQWNAKVEAYFSTNSINNTANLFTNQLANTEAIQSLQLNKIYIITSKATASASELVINCLKPYITVVQIGDTTIGKNVGSITLYDSPDFSKKDCSTKHRYAMQPLVLKIVNKTGFGDYTNGISPDLLLKENLGNLGTLGNQNEPLLAATINLIINGGKTVQPSNARSYEPLADKRLETQLKMEMYVPTPSVPLTK